MVNEKKTTEIKRDAESAARRTAADANAAASEVRNDASVAGSQLRQDAEAAVDTARHDLKDLGHEAKHQVDSVVRDAKAGASEVVREASGIANDQKNLLASQIGGVADALDRVAGELSGNNAQVAGYVHAAADRARDMTRTVRDSSVEQIVARAEDFGRKQPLLFVGGAALAGFAASRFLRASAHHSRQSR